MALPWLVPAISGAATLASMFGKKPKAPKTPTIDTSAIMAEIDKLYAAQESATQANLSRSLAGLNKQTSESLAGRGIYRSPVSEQSFIRNREAYSSSLADALSGLAGQRAQSKANVLSSAASLEAQQRYNAQLAKYQQQMESRNLLTGLLAAGTGAAAKAAWPKLF